MGRTLGVSQIMSKKYSYYELDQEWIDGVGLLSKPFTLLVYGKPKNGKTSFVMKLCKHLTKFGKVYYNSAEEGDSKTIQDALILAKMEESPAGKFMIGDRDTFLEMKEKLAKKNSGAFVVIDSIDYLYFDVHQYKKLIEEFPNKSFIIISWEKGGEPKSQAARDIKHMVGAVVHVKNHVAHTIGRYGPTEPYVIWDKKAPKKEEQLQIFNK
jgi:KaiC/GvpD/RAD55 family RecA-like ATPase